MRESGRRQERRGSDVETPPSPKSLGPCPTLLMCLDPSSSAKPNTRFLSISALKCISPKNEGKTSKTTFLKAMGTHPEQERVSIAPLYGPPKRGIHLHQTATRDFGSPNGPGRIAGPRALQQERCDGGRRIFRSLFRGLTSASVLMEENWCMLGSIVDMQCLIYLE